MADKKGATPAQIDLAWLLARKPFIVPIPGTTNIEHQQENFGAAKVELTVAELQELETAFAKVKVFGKRAPESLLVANELHKKGYNVIGTSRNPEKNQSSLPFKILVLDITDDNSVKSFGKQLFTEI